jgi:hypothetical protein
MKNEYHLRQPLQSATIYGVKKMPEEYCKLIRDSLNVKELFFKNKKTNDYD